MCERNINWLPLSCPQLGTQPTTQACALTGNRTGDFSICRLVLNPPSHTSQGPIKFLKTAGPGRSLWGEGMFYMP